MISVVIPAYNEEAVIARTLDSVLAALEHEPGEIVVACNGCRDRTYEIASSFGDPVRVIQTETGSKPLAWNLGDEAASHFPRFYLDADIELAPDALSLTADLLRGGEVLAAAPAMRTDLTRSSWPVRAFYDVWSVVPYHAAGHLGSGFFALSEAGRARFGPFPDLVADDEFVRRQFAPHERKIVEDTWFSICPPADFTNLLAVKTRSRFGTFQLASKHPELTSGDHAGGWGRTLRTIAGRPSLWPKLPVYMAVNTIVRRRAASRMRAAAEPAWDRDETSRLTTDAAAR
ncbi:MAG: glycosyltransferase [Planctomycetota bacterium]